MRYYIIAGEASGDLHGSNLIKAIIKKDPQAVIHCWGGELMENAGGKLVKHYRDLAFMGFIEVIKNLSTIVKNISYCKQDISQFKPDTLILIDYPGFNLRIAKWAKINGYKVVYYISPQVWAWKENRVRKMKRYIDLMFVILPFEKKYYQEKWNWDVEYVGHPLIEAIHNFKQRNTKPVFKFDKPVIALLPGSRRQEIKVKLPIMLEVCRRFPDYQFVIAKAPGIEAHFYDELISGYSNISYVINQTYALLQIATAALVTSGTATLETALFKVPQVVCYKGSKISYEIAKRVIRIKYISLVNLIMDKPVIHELIQDELTPINLEKELQKILPGSALRDQIMQDYTELESLLLTQTNASERVAQIISTI
ncbi:MAG: lipid-A-disaccharide synthase [Bacteroidota bacterium]|jgi:lipid-A-disaccharide synthase